MTILTASFVAAAALLTLALAKATYDASRPKPVRAIANRVSHASRLATVAVALLVPAFAAAVAYYSA